MQAQIGLMSNKMLYLSQASLKLEQCCSCYGLLFLLLTLSYSVPIRPISVFFKCQCWTTVIQDITVEGKSFVAHL